MKFHFLGTGNAFGHGGRRRSHYLWEGSLTLLIDASYDALAGLRSIGRDVSSIDIIFLSHLHPDHFMALPQFALENYYAIKSDECIPVYGPVGTEDMIHNATKFFFNDEVTEHLTDLYEFHEIGPGKEITWEAGTLKTLDADHTGNARMQIIQMDEVSLGYTGDTGMIEKALHELFSADFTITEASSGNHQIPQHLTLHELLEFEIPNTSRVYISHVGESTLAMSNQVEPPLYMSYDGLVIDL